MVGILYESDEWSDWKLKRELEAFLGEPVAMIDMESPTSPDEAATCDELISRVFASAVFRGHMRSEQSMRSVIETAMRQGTLMINPPKAHAYEVSKALSTDAMGRAGIAVPAILDLGRPGELAARAGSWRWPCIIKPDRGGRTTHTAVLHSKDGADVFLSGAPDMPFIVEEYIESAMGYLTRIEIVDGGAMLVVKRSVAANGLSSYHEGSTYEMHDDCPKPVKAEAERAAALLGIRFGSFDVIETGDGKVCVIDANSVSNVSEDCTSLFEGFDLMREHARGMARIIRARRIN